MTSESITIDDVLTRFFEQRMHGSTGIRRSRMGRVEAKLRDCIEVEGERILVTDDLALIAVERQFAPDGAIARTMHANDLVFALSIFAGSEWLAEESEQRRMQLSLIEALTAHLVSSRFVDRDEVCCPLLDIRCAIDRERRTLTRIRREARVGRAEGGAA